MKLPNRQQVDIPKSKLTDYLLSETHAVGKFKAKYFHKLGFTKSNIELLEKALRKIAQTQEVAEKITSVYGTKYIIEGTIKTPVGKKVTIQTIWLIESGQRRPRFVTAYPV